MTFPPKFEDGSRLFRPSQSLKIVERRLTALDASPILSEQYGIDVSRSTMVLFSLSVVLPAVIPSGWAAEVVVWRLKTEPNGTLARSGQWYATEVDTFSLDATAIVAGRPQERAYPTLNSEKMYFQVRSMSVSEGVVPPTFTLNALVTELGRRTESTEDLCCPAAGATASAPAMAEAVHDDPVIATGIHPMSEAKAVDGTIFPNVVDEGDAVRSAASLAGVPYANIVTINGNNTAVQSVDTEIDIDGGDNGVVMAGFEAYNYDGGAMPEIADTDGDATRTRASRRGVLYTMPMTQNGGATAIVPDETTPSAAAGGLANIMAGVVAQAVQAAAVGAGESSHLVANLFRELITAAYDYASQADRQEEQDPIDTRDIPDMLADGATVAQATTVDFYLDMAHLKFLSLYWAPSDANFTLTVEASNEDNGTAPAACAYFDVTNQWFGAASFVAAAYLERTVPVITKWVHIQIVRADAVGNGTHTLFTRRSY